VARRYGSGLKASHTASGDFTIRTDLELNTSGPCGFLQERSEEPSVPILNTHRSPTLPKAYGASDDNAAECAEDIGKPGVVECHGSKDRLRLGPLPFSLDPGGIQNAIQPSRS